MMTGDIERGKQVEEFKQLIDAFKAKYSLQDLYTLEEFLPGVFLRLEFSEELKGKEEKYIELSPEEEQQLNLWMSVNKDLKELEGRVGSLPFSAGDLRTAYWEICRAVGIKKEKENRIEHRIDLVKK